MRISTLRAGARFRTALTHVSGIVVREAHRQTWTVSGVAVGLDSREGECMLHPDVLVERVA